MTCAGSPPCPRKVPARSASDSALRLTKGAVYGCLGLTTAELPLCHLELTMSQLRLSPVNFLISIKALAAIVIAH